MAAPVYATNLTDITTAQATTNFTAVGGGGAITAETDFYIQDGTCVSKATSATWDSSGTARGGVLYNAGTGLTIPTDGAVLVWMYWWGPGVLATKAAGGAEVNFGNATTAYYGQYVSGSDDWEFGGWRCYPVDPNLTPRDRTQGTPNGTWQYFGWQANVAAANSIGKGNPYGIDAMRYGRCDLVVTDGDLANGYATFLGAANWDNTGTRRLGLLTPLNGAYYMQGLFQLGTSGTAVDFRDANRAIFIQNTEKVSSAFNRIEVNNASSRVDWSSISISALGTVARGNFEAVNNADINIDGCTFTDMGTFIFQSNSTIIGSTFRRCGQITAGGAAFTDCLITNTTAVAAVSAASLNLFDNCTFVSDGSSHAVDLGTISSTTSMNWDCFATGYAGSNGSSGNETIKVNVASGQTLTINVGAGYTTPTYYNTGTGTVTVVSGQVTTTITVTTVSGTPIQNARVLLRAGGAANFGSINFLGDGYVSRTANLPATSALTVCTWGYLRSYGSIGRVPILIQTNTGGSDIVVVTISPSGDVGLYTNTGYDSGYDLDLNSFYYFALTVAGNGTDTIRLRVWDATQTKVVDFAIDGGTLGSVTESVYIGAEGNQKHWDGYISLGRVFSSVLSESQQEAERDAAIPVNTGVLNTAFVDDGTDVSSNNYDWTEQNVGYASAAPPAGGSGGPLPNGQIIFNDLTDSNGQVTDIRSLAADQPVTGWVRKSTSAPYYKTSQITATIDNASGLTLNVLMIPDE